MGSLLASAILDKAGRVLQDAGHDKWDEPELLDWLNAGQREIVIIDPTAHTTNEVIPLVAGTKQTLPTGRRVLLEVTRNMGTNSTTPGRVPDAITRKDINRENPNWHTGSASATVYHVIYDADIDATHFYVSPPQPANGMGSLEVICSTLPEEVEDETSPITVDDAYEGALINYILFRAYSKDTSYAREDAAAGSYYKLFVALVGGKDSAEQAKGAPK